MTDVLRIEGLSAGYGSLRVLHDLDLTVHSRERLAIVGLNGHGKTTLLRAIVGLTGWQSGSIVLLGRQIGGRRMYGPGRHTHRIVRQGVAFIPQGDDVFPGLTVRQNIDVGAYTRAAWGQRIERRIRVLDLFPALQDRLNTPVAHLSGGERRMVSIGSALMSDAVVYLVDEPTMGLSVKAATTVLRALFSIDIKDEGAMVICEQNLTLLKGRVDRILGMHSGKIKLGVESLIVGGQEEAQGA
jgi:branched-chain amino acid transport system ATP-binding protein